MSTLTHIKVETWASTTVVNEPDRMPDAAHAGDRCAMADRDCGVTFAENEVVYMPLHSSGIGSELDHSHAKRGLWVCGLHVWTPEGNYGGERQFI